MFRSRNISRLSYPLKRLQYDQAHAANERKFAGKANWRRVNDKQWARILHFVDFFWRGEQFQLAVVQPWNVKPWLTGRERSVLSDPPELLSSPKQLQAMTVRALRHVAGRVPIYGANAKFVIFDTSLGLLVPEML